MRRSLAAKLRVARRWLIPGPAKRVEDRQHATPCSRCSCQPPTTFTTICASPRACSESSRKRCSLFPTSTPDCGPGFKTDGSSASLSVPPPSNASLQHGYREYRNSDGNNGWGSPSFLQASRVPVARCVYILFISSLPKMTFRRMICPPTMSLLNSDNWNIRT